MLTERLQDIRDNISEKKRKSTYDVQLLGILNQMDQLENSISLGTPLTYPPSINSEILLEMIIRPGTNQCTVCGRTLK